MIRILLDSSADFSAEEAKERNMELVPINITMNGKNYLDGVDITKDEFYDMLVNSEEFPMTAQPSPQDYLDIFEDWLIKIKEKKQTSKLIIGLYLINPLNSQRNYIRFKWIYNYIN